MKSNSMQPISAADIEIRPAPECSTCGRPMEYYGGTAGWICCETKILTRTDGWFDASGRHVRDERINGSRVSDIRQRPPRAASGA